MEVKNIEINGFDVWGRIGAKGAEHKGFVIAWQANIGWGELSVYMTKDGKLLIDTECLGKDFAKQVLCQLVDEAEEM